MNNECRTLLSLVAQEKLESLQRENERLQQQIQTSLRPPNMIGNSDTMRSVCLSKVLLSAKWSWFEREISAPFSGQLALSSPHPRLRPVRARIQSATATAVCPCPRIIHVRDVSANMSSPLPRTVRIFGQSMVSPRPHMVWKSPWRSRRMSAPASTNDAPHPLCCSDRHGQIITGAVITGSSDLTATTTGIEEQVGRYEFNVRLPELDVESEKS